MKRTVRAAAASLTAGSALVLLPAAVAAPGTIAVGADGESTDEVAALVEQVTGSEPDLSLEAIGAMIVRVEDVEAALPALEDVEGVAYVEKIDRLALDRVRPERPARARASGTWRRFMRSRSGLSSAGPDACSRRRRRLRHRQAPS